MLLYIGDDSAVYNALKKKYPNTFSLESNDKTLYSKIKQAEVIVLDLSSDGKIETKNLFNALHIKNVIVIIDPTDKKILNEVNDSIMLPLFCFHPFLMPMLMKKIELFYAQYKEMIESDLYLPGIENVFNLNARFGKTLEKNYLDHIGTFILILDTKKNVRYINKLGCEILGYAKEEIIGKNFIENFLPKNYHLRVTEVAKSLTSKYAEKISYYINPVLTNTGEERLISWTNTSLEQDDGTPIALLTSGIDITEQHKAEEDLKGYKLRQNALMELLPQYIFVKDINLNYEMINKSLSSLFKIEPDDVIGKNDYDFFPKDLAEKYREDDRQVITSGEAYEREEVYIKEGKRRVTFTMKKPTYDENNEINGLIAISWDISEKKENEQILLQQQRFVQMGEMISMIAHQWRQPLGSISAIVSKLQLEKILNKQTDESLTNAFKSIEDHVVFLSDTINDFRNFFKSDNKQELITVDEIITTAEKMFGFTFSDHGISVIKNIDKSPEFYSFKNELIQVILNLFRNAVDIIVERACVNPTVTIESQVVNDYIEIKVVDNASGIEEILLERIFEPYFSTKHEKHGTGLGLYMSKVIIEDHCKGTLRAINTSDGLCIKMRLPLKLEI